MKSSMTKVSHYRMIITYARFYRINLVQAIPTSGTGQVLTFEKQNIKR